VTSKEAEMGSVGPRGQLARLIRLAICIVLVPAWASSAQSIRPSLTGTITDSSMAVLPGVTVEVSSPALIERTRSTVTDASGGYRIIELESGTYTVTFTLPGFNTVKREGVVLSGSNTLTLNAEMQVGSLDETITVTGESPTVDVQNSRQSQVIDKNIVTDMPLARTPTEMASILVPAMNAGLGAYGAAGTGPETGRLQVDGVGVGSGTSGTSQYRPDAIQAQEMVISSFGNLGEAEVGSPVVNLIPRSGGNTFSGTFYADGANGAMSSDNTKDLVAAGVLRAPNEMIHTSQLNIGIGGPIRRDKLWFFANARHQTDDAYVANIWVNKNAGNPNAWTYDPDLAQRGTNKNWYANGAIRLTWQAASKHKFTLFWDEQRKCERCGPTDTNSATISPEAATPGYIPGKRQYWRVQQLNWTAPMNNKLLLEAGIGYPNSLYGEPSTPEGRQLTQVQEQGGVIPGLVYRSPTFSRNRGGLVRWMGSASYISGAHNLKFGVDGERFYQVRELTAQQDGLVQFRFNNGVPNRLTMGFSNWRYALVVLQHAGYAQDSATFGRLTVHGGVRLDYANSYAPPQPLYAQTFVPQEIDFPKTQVVKGFLDVSPRFGAAYNLRGDGKTSLRVSLGRYLSAVNADGIYASTAPVAMIGGGGARTSPSTTRTWNDRNNNFVPDCDLRNKASNGECGPWATQNFGELLTSTTDPRLTGNDGMWFRRPYDWGFGLAVQHALRPHLSVDAAYNRRWWGNTTVIDNRSIASTDFDKYSITAPSDPRLPGGGGYSIGDLWDIQPAKFGLTSNYEVPVQDFGRNVRYFHAFDFNVRGQLKSLTVRGSSSTGRQVTDTCDLIVDNPSRRDCHAALPFQTTFSGMAAYTVPKVRVQASGVLHSTPGSQILANLVVPSATIAPSLGRPLAGGAANVTINLLSPGQLYRDRVTLLDLRFAKLLDLGHKRLNIGLDIFNVFNSDVVLNSNNTYGAAWQTPTSVQSARQLQASMRFDF
jgi:hypothetical protein